jgi:xanthine dehydrogenase D subunit
MTRLAAPPARLLGVGDSPPRVDAVLKLTGAFTFGSDLQVPDMLWGVTLRSTAPHARIRSIDVTRAVAASGVHAVLVAADVPGQKTYGVEFPDQPVLADRVVHYVGEPIALVAADTRWQAAAALSAIAVEYEPMPAVLDMEDALRPETTKLREWGNVLRHVRIEHGDPEAIADVWVEGYYQTGMQDQAALGPEAGLAIPAPDGGVDLHISTQWLHVDRQQIARCLNLPLEKVRLYIAGVGGAFGGREDISVQIHASLLALRTGRPVKMSYLRSESFVGHVHRHPFRIWMRHGANRDGRLVSVRARLVADGGAYASTSTSVIANAATFATGPYLVPNALVDATVVYTNNPPCGAMRGFGSTQVCFGYEAQMDKLAKALGIDPVELRRRNVLATGSVLVTGQPIRGSAPAREVIDACLALPLPAEPDPVDRDPLSWPGGSGGSSRGEGVRRGVGFALGYKNIGFSEGFDDTAEVRLELVTDAEGPLLHVRTAAVECGQGLLTVITQIVRTELGIARVFLHDADTSIGSAGSTSASRQTVMTGGAVAWACRLVLDELGRRAQFSGGEVSLADGWLMVGGDRIRPVADLLDEPVQVTYKFHHRPTARMDDWGQGDPHVMLAFCAQRVIVEVDVELGLVRLVQIACAADIGRAINPLGVVSQIEGGIAQGIGLALFEELVVNQGRILNGSFTDYLIPTILDVPPISVAIVEVPEPDAPFGAKGVGEHGTLVAAAAVAAALRDATGRPVSRLPAQPLDLVDSDGESPTVPPWPPSPPVPGNDPLPWYFRLRVDQGGIR